MKVIAAILADFDATPLGTPCRLETVIAGETVLRRTLRRVLAARHIASVHLLASVAQAERARAAVGDLDVKVETHDAAPVPWVHHVAAGRKWALDGWRGGIGGLTVFDEWIHPWLLEALARREQAVAIAAIPSNAPLLDPAMLDRLIDHFRTVSDDVRMVFTQSAPGLTAPVLLPALLADLAKVIQPLGRVMAYHPAEPHKDMVMQPCFLSPEAVVSRARGRMLADTQAGIERIEAVLREAGAAGNGAAPAALSAEAVSQWLTGHKHEEPLPLPAEVEIELTTRDPLASSTLRPRGGALGDERGPMDLAMLERLTGELASRDDMRVVLGGFGDPLLHPRFVDVLSMCRRAGLFGLAVRTPLVALDEAALRALIDARVDVVNVLIDAATPETYLRIHNADHFAAVTANVERLIEAQRDNRGLPLVVCEMIKCHATYAEIEPFYDHWLNRTGGAVIAGPSDFAGQFPDVAVMDMTPPSRRPCERIFHRAIVLADGRVTVCDQDFRGLHALGTLAESSLSALWNSEGMSRVRRSHLDGADDAMPLCPRCREWHRP